MNIKRKGYLFNEIYILKICFFLLIPCVFLSCSSHSEKKYLAKVNGVSISSITVDSLIKQELFDELNRIYQIRDKSLNQIIRKEVFRQEVSLYNKTEEEYIQLLFKKKYLDSNVDSLLSKYSNLQMPIRNRLKKIGWNTIEGKYLIPDLIKDNIVDNYIDSVIYKYTIEKYLYPPANPQLNIEKLITEYKGNEDSNTTFYLISDFSCSECREFKPIADSLYSLFGKNVKFGYVNYSAFPTLEALSSIYFGNIGKFWEYYDYVYSIDKEFTLDCIYDFVLKNNLDFDKIQEKITSQETYDKIQSTYQSLQKMGIYATPTVIINNRIIYSNSFSEIEFLLRRELKRYE